mmetsp:Transcript_45917/g.112003  ORF Transcript_45917/g.112003 Transcript_45917/m.112003 type:complete len:115 (-) Transcript_45917:167-511(-)
MALSNTSAMQTFMAVVEGRKEDLQNELNHAREANAFGNKEAEDFVQLLIDSGSFGNAMEESCGKVPQPALDPPTLPRGVSDIAQGSGTLDVPAFMHDAAERARAKNANTTVFNI